MPPAGLFRDTAHPQRKCAQIQAETPRNSDSPQDHLCRRVHRRVLSRVSPVPMLAAAHFSHFCGSPIRTMTKMSTIWSVQNHCFCAPYFRHYSYCVVQPATPQGSAECSTGTPETHPSSRHNMSSVKNRAHLDGQRIFSGKVGTAPETQSAARHGKHRTTAKLVAWPLVAPFELG